MSLSSTIDIGYLHGFGVPMFSELRTTAARERGALKVTRRPFVDFARSDARVGVMRCLSKTTLLFTTLLVLSGCMNSERAPAGAQAAKASDTSTAAVATADASATTNDASASSVHPDAATPPAASASGSVYGWSDVVSLTGTLIEKEVLSARGGSIKTTFLVLDVPISVHDKSGEKLGNCDGERELWYAAEGKPSAPGIVGKRVTFRGRLNPMQTAHHHSNVWLTGDVTPLVR